MPKLISSVLDESSISQLASVKIFSVYDFVQANGDRIALNSNLTLEEVFKLKEEYITKFSSCIRNGLELYSSRNHNPIKTHIKGLDNFLHGGLKRSSIIELCGLSGSGKTQLCLSIALNVASQSGVVFYIDTKSDFSAKRCKQLLPSALDDEETAKILEKLTVYDVKNNYELISVLYKLKEFLKSIDPNRKEILIVIDSITAPYLPLLGIAYNKGTSLLNVISSNLKELAFEYNLSVLLTNLGTEFVGTDPDDSDAKNMRDISQDIKPFLGKFWQHIPNTRILVKRLKTNDNVRKFIINKSNNLSIGKVSYVDFKDLNVSL